MCGRAKVPRAHYSSPIARIVTRVAGAAWIYAGTARSRPRTGNARKRRSRAKDQLCRAMKRLISWLISSFSGTSPNPKPP